MTEEQVKKFDMISQAIKETTSGEAVFGFEVTKI